MYYIYREKKKWVAVQPVSCISSFTFSCSKYTFIVICREFICNNNNDCKQQFNGQTSPVEECFEYDFQLVKAENYTQNTPSTGDV